MRELNDTFYLVYYSGDAAFRDKLPCLSARKSRLDTGRKSCHYLYQYSSNTTVILSGAKDVDTKRKDNAYKHHNVMVVWYEEEGVYGKHDIELLYTDYRTCAVLKSTLLGIQMWVSSIHLKEAREIPWLCTIVYDLATDKPRQVLYDWKECPQRLNVKKVNKKITL
uniref:Putative salivary lipocalin lipocalin n=1 Tax=Ixodes ricinus TaxID=34613 RepID=A0A147BW67_IXORI